MEFNSKSHPNMTTAEVLALVRRALSENRAVLGDDEWHNAHEVTQHFTYSGLHGYAIIVGDADWEHGKVTVLSGEGGEYGTVVNGTVYCVSAYLSSLREPDLAHCLPDSFFFGGLK